jgi:hypothetical protein
LRDPSALSVASIEDFLARLGEAVRAPRVAAAAARGCTTAVRRGAGSMHVPRRGAARGGAGGAGQPEDRGHGEEVA